MTARDKLVTFLSTNADMLTPSQAARVEAMSKSAGQVGALGVGGGSLPVSSALALIAHWLKLATAYREYGKRLKTSTLSRHREQEAKIYEACAVDLRRQIEAASVRQPEENTASEPTRRTDL